MNDNTSLRNTLESFINHYGSTGKFISSQTGISQSMISRFIKGERNLSLSNFLKIKNFIEKFNQNKGVIL